jgi:hypothetical protein
VASPAPDAGVTADGVADNVADGSPDKRADDAPADVAPHGPSADGAATPDHAPAADGEAEGGDETMAEDQRRVTVTNIDIPFGRLVMFMIKLTLAAIPAGFLLLFALTFFLALMGMVFGGMGVMMREMWGV